MFDSLVGSVLGKVMGDKAGMAQVAMEIFNNNGGLSGIVDKFKAGGLSEQVASWVGMGENIAVSPEQVSSVMGKGAIADIADKFGLSPEVLSAQIAQYLPTVVDKLTPNGQINAESGGELLSTVLGMLK
jgi:uncharacterized protein YidB (DUF937 family)